MKTHFLALVAAVGLAAPAFAQSGQTTQPQMQNRGAQQGAQAPAARSGQAMTAAQFMTQVMQSDSFEMQSAQLASERAQDAAVKTYAQKMLADHGKTSAALMQMRGETTASTGQAGHGNMAPLDQKHATMIRELQAANGAAFDKRYVQQQVMAHQEAVALFTAYSQNGTDQNLRSFASQNLPTLQGHLRDAQALMSQMR
jgi:putative membrane protein